jgi:glycosyltransferase involved in cell wall biosynthesis
MIDFVWIMPPFREEDGGPYTSVQENISKVIPDQTVVISLGKICPKLKQVMHDSGLKYRESRVSIKSIYGFGFLEKSERRVMSSSNTILVEGFYGFPALIAVSICKSGSNVYVIPHGAVGQPNLKSRLAKNVFHWLFTLISKKRKITIAFLAFSNFEKKHIESIFKKSRIDVLQRTIKFREIEKKSTSHELLFLGRLSPEKGIEEVLELFWQFQLSDKRFSLTVAGSGTPQYFAHLKRRCSELGIDKQVRFLGWVDGAQKENLLRKSSALICLSPFESLGLSIIEGIQFQVPIFTSANVGAAEIVEHFRVGQVIRSTENVCLQFKDFIASLPNFVSAYDSLSKSRELIWFKNEKNYWKE